LSDGSVAARTVEVPLVRALAGALVIAELVRLAKGRAKLPSSICICAAPNRAGVACQRRIYDNLKTLTRSSSAGNRNITGAADARALSGRAGGVHASEK